MTKYERLLHLESICRHRQKRVKEIQKKIKRGLIDPDKVWIEESVG
jgi:hypothetical protein